jgi:hypothetical protein
MMLDDDLIEDILFMRENVNPRGASGSAQHLGGAKGRVTAKATTPGAVRPLSSRHARTVGESGKHVVGKKDRGHAGSAPHHQGLRPASAKKARNGGKGQHRRSRSPKKGASRSSSAPWLTSASSPPSDPSLMGTSNVSAWPLHLLMGSSGADSGDGRRSGDHPESIDILAVDCPHWIELRDSYLYQMEYAVSNNLQKQFSLLLSAYRNVSWITI